MLTQWITSLQLSGCPSDSLTHLRHVHDIVIRVQLFTLGISIAPARCNWVSTWY
jgi:hypothetical protein